MHKILITGASGFVGNYFINKYFDRYTIQTFSFLKDDFASLRIDGIKTIVHLSALVHQMGGANADEYERVNVTQTLELAKKAKDSGVGHFIFMSSVKVYGEECDVPYGENSICKPKDEYGRSKLKAENELQKLVSDDFVVSIIRTPIVYGYGVKANIKNLISLVRKVSVLPFGNIYNQRSMVYVGNLCFFMDAIIEKKINGIFLLADEKSLSTTKLIELIANALGKKIYLIQVPFFEGFLKLVKPSFHKRLFESLEVDNSETIKRLFGDAKVCLPFCAEDGIELMLNGKEK